MARFREPLLRPLEECFEQSFNKDVTFARNTQRKTNLRAFAHRQVAEALLRHHEHTSATPNIQLQRAVQFKTFRVAHIGVHRCFLTSPDPVVRKNFLLFLSQVAPKNTTQRWFTYDRLCFYDTLIHSFVFLVGPPDSLFCTPICLCGKFDKCYAECYSDVKKSNAHRSIKQRFTLAEVRACLTIRRYCNSPSIESMFRGMQSMISTEQHIAAQKRKSSDNPPSSQIQKRRKK